MNILCYGPLSLSLHAQRQNEAKVTLSLRNATVEEFAMEVARQTGLTISYDNDNVKTLRGVTFDVREQSLSSLLLTLSNQLPLAYSMEGDTLKLARKEPAQRKTGIYGQVTDEHGEPLIGAIIRVEGVIVITTKALKGGKLKLNYSGTLRLSTPDLHDYHLLNAGQKLEYERLAGLFSDSDPSRQYALDREYARLFNEVQNGVDTDGCQSPFATSSRRRTA